MTYSNRQYSLIYSSHGAVVLPGVLSTCLLESQTKCVQVTSQPGLLYHISYMLVKQYHLDSCWWCIETDST